MNICGFTAAECSPSSPVCKRSGLWTLTGYGSLNNQTIGRIELPNVAMDKGVTVHYSNGQQCPTSDGTSSTIHVICGSAEAITSVEYGENKCSLVATINSKAGCGKPIPYY